MAIVMGEMVIIRWNLGGTPSSNPMNSYINHSDGYINYR
jgi:hypothetical protein